MSISGATGDETPAITTSSCDRVQPARRHLSGHFRDIQHCKLKIHPVILHANLGRKTLAGTHEDRAGGHSRVHRGCSGSDGVVCGVSCCWLPVATARSFSSTISSRCTVPFILVSIWCLDTFLRRAGGSSFRASMRRASALLCLSACASRSARQSGRTTKMGCISRHFLPGPIFPPWPPIRFWRWGIFPGDAAEMSGGAYSHGGRRADLS